MSGWACPHNDQGRCKRVKKVACDPGMKGCTLYGRFRFANEDKNSPRKRRLREAGARVKDDQA